MNLSCLFPPLPRLCCLCEPCCDWLLPCLRNLGRCGDVLSDLIGLSPPPSLTCALAALSDNPSLDFRFRFLGDVCGITGDTILSCIFLFAAASAEALNFAPPTEVLMCGPMSMCVGLGAFVLPWSLRAKPLTVVVVEVLGESSKCTMGLIAR